MGKRKALAVAVIAIALAATMVGCSAASTARQNVKWAADNFEVVRELTVFDNVTGEILFIAQGRMTIEVDENESQLEITVAQPDDVFEMHYVGLNETTTYVVRDMSGVEVDGFRYKLAVNPDMLIPFEFGIVTGGDE